MKPMDDLKTIRSPELKRLASVILVFFGITAMLTVYSLVFFQVKANFREVVPRKVYRSGQPSPAQLKDWVHRYGIKTVLNLRGDAGKITKAEQATVNELGVRMISIGLSAYSVPTKSSLAKLIETIETADQPMLIHCRGGVDRSGTASALAAMAIGKADYETAKWQAYVPPGPWKRKQKPDYTHISDIFKLYESYCRSNALNTNDWRQFKQWAIDMRTLADTKCYTESR